MSIFEPRNPIYIFLKDFLNLKSNVRLIGRGHDTLCGDSHGMWVEFTVEPIRNSCWARIDKEEVPLTKRERKLLFKQYFKIRDRIEKEGVEACKRVDEYKRLQLFCKINENFNWL